MKQSRVLYVLLCALISTSMYAKDDTKETNALNIPPLKEKFHVFILISSSGNVMLRSIQQ